MANELAAARAGLKTRLETITGLTVSLYGGAPLPQMPMAVITQEQGPRLLTVGSGNTFQARFKVRVYLNHPGSETDGWTEIEKYTEQVGTLSIIAAILGDRTLGGAADVTRVQQPVSIGKAPLDENGPVYYSADFLVDVYKTVA